MFIPCLSWKNKINVVKLKVSPLQAMKAHVGCEYKGPHIQNHALGRGRAVSPTLVCLYRGKVPGTHFVED